MYPDNYLYTAEHEWLAVDGEECTLGITQFAQEELGEVVFVELPEIGRAVAAKEEIGTIESVKAVAEFYTPVAGEIVAVNEGLVDEPETVNNDPYGGGWLVKIRLDPAVDLPSDLMDADGYQDFVAGENA